MIIEVKDLCFSYKKHKVLNEVNLKIESNQAVALIGPNGAGKTTLFKCLLGFFKPESGQVLIDGKDVSLYSQKELSKLIAYIPQNYNAVFNHSVLDVVLMGLTNQIGYFESPSKEHINKAMDTLKLLGIDYLSQRGCMEISGGERQLMLMARAIVQNAKIFVMDEPTANLDFGNTVKVLNQIETLIKSGYSVLFSTHNPNQALNICSKIFILKDGKIIADSFDKNILKKLYGVDLKFCKTCGQIQF